MADDAKKKAYSIASCYKVEGGKKYADQYLELAKQARKLLKK